MAQNVVQHKRSQARIKRLCFAFCAALTLAGTQLGHAEVPPPPSEGQNTATRPSSPNVEVSLGQARVLAQQALAKGQLALAIKIARGLLQADPNDPSAHFILAAAMAKTGNIKQARKSAARAYRFSDNPRDRVAAAQFAARAALGEEKPTLTQLWLRRAAVHANDEVSQKRIAQDYRRVRNLNPLSFRVALGFRPSDNVNNGADSALNVIDGLPTVGQLSGSAQALAGNVGTLDVDLRYRLRRTERAQLDIGSRLYVRRVWLSSSAREQAPDLENEDLNSTRFDVSLNNTFALGAKGNSANVGVSLGRAWSGEDESYDFVGLDIGRSIRLGDRTRLTLSASLEDRRSAQDPILDQTEYRLGAHLGHTLDNGDRVGLAFGISDTGSDHFNIASEARTVRASYAFAKALGPAKVSTSLTVGQSDFDAFRIGFIEVPDGRQDDSVYGDVTFFFTDWDYAGFAPSVRVRAGRRDSNVSRYDSREFSVDFQIRSTF